MILASSSRHATLAISRRSIAPFSSSAVRCALSSKDQHQENGQEDGGDGAEKVMTFPLWMEEQGSRFKYPHVGQPNWLARDRPFPMNPSFKPPRPTADKLRQIIFDRHISDPEKFSIRALSEKHQLSLKRVEAIIRLKSLEVQWKMSDRPLRLNFQAGMESALGAKMRPINPNEDLQPWEKADVAADEGSTSSVSGKGIDKIWWEGVKKGEEPIVGPHLAALAEQATERLASSQAAKAQFAESHSHVVPPKVAGRSPTVFVDVGVRFMNHKDELQRQKAAEARKRLKTKKAAKQLA